ncbi:hypothetical protein OPQ81_005258 [Rhizoctonia solani]|nr:hypothetical protein OPQ81_005258 [Rhizoctonia solani]
MNTIENGSLIILVEHDLVNSELWIGSCVPVAVYYRSKSRQTENSSSHQILVSAHGHHIPVHIQSRSTLTYGCEHGVIPGVLLFIFDCSGLLTRHFETQPAQEMWQPLLNTS